MPSGEEVGSTPINYRKSSSSEGLNKQEVRAGAGAAGAGSGTLLALIANNMPDDNELKPWLILAAPSVSVVFGAMWVWLQAKVVSYVREREFKLVISEAKETLDKELQDPDLSSDRQLELRQMRDELSKLEIERVMNKVKSLRITIDRNPAN